MGLSSNKGLRKIAVAALLGVLSLVPMPPVAQAQEVVRLWELPAGQDVGRCTFSPDGKLLAAAVKGKVMLWKVATGEPLEALRSGSEDWVTSLTFSPDSKTLATGDMANVYLWDVEKSTLTRKMEGHRGAISVLTFSTDGQSLASGSLDKTVRLWNVATGESVRTLEGFTFYPAAMAFRDEGKALAVAGGTPVSEKNNESSSLEISQYNVSTGEQLKAETHGELGLPVTFSPNGNLVAAMGKVAFSRTSPTYKETAVRLYNVGESQFMDSVYQAEGVQQLTFTPDGKTLGITKRYIVDFWDGQSPPPRRGRDMEGVWANWSPVGLVALSPDSKTYSMVKSKNMIRIYRFPQGKMVSREDK